MILPIEGERKTFKRILLWLITILNVAPLIFPTNTDTDNVELKSGRGFYTAGVVEYKPIEIGGRSPTEAMLENVKEYEKLMESAATQNVDVIVFPEYGITTVGMAPGRESSKEFLVELPRFGTVPCNEEGDVGNQKILHRLSCAAKQNQMYLVVNLGELENCDSSRDPNCPSDRAYHYNTNVVFDRNGSLIARYRKFHLYFEPQFDTPTLEYSSFQADFGVEFGLFTCFDIIFAYPAVELVARTNIRDFVFPTAWVDELPFLTGIQVQSLWAQSNGANLLASGYHAPGRGSLGSGIYSRDQALNYTFDPATGTRLIIANVPINNEGRGQDEPKTSDLSVIDVEPKVPDGESQDHDKAPPPYHMWLREDLSNYTSKVLDPKLKEDVLCHLGLLCCHFEYDLILSSGHEAIDQFRFLAFEGRRTVAAKTDSFEWQVCAVVHCLNDTLESCTEREPSPATHHDFLNRHLHPKFKTLSVQMHPLKNEDYGDSPAQASLSLIDTHFKLIPQSLFNLSQWKDLTTNNSYAKAMSKNEENILDVNVKTVGLIQKMYNGR